MQHITLQLHINGAPVQVPAGCTVAAALYLADGLGITRHAVSGQARAPVCGMGICQECRVRVNGQRRLACQTVCTSGMQVETTP